ncbi:MAG TPA: transglycosylase family protein [Pseudonocardiaceae bacterium]|nr:transglycosylase family protein [Pseudonocardiaceae bacterium]
MGRHSKPSKTKTLLKRTGVITALAGATAGGIAVTGAGTANAFPGQAGLVRCESGGHPAIVNNTPAGRRAGRPAGLFQIVTGTWLANGGGQFAPTADRAAAWQQQVVANRIYAKQGAAPWECKPGPGPARFSNFPRPAKAAQHHAPRSVTRAVVVDSKPNSHPQRVYTVVAGDTLSGIAHKFDVPGGWRQLQRLNSHTVPNADLILVGEKIVTR